MKQKYKGHHLEVVKVKSSRGEWYNMCVCASRASDGFKTIEDVVGNHTRVAEAMSALKEELTRLIEEVKETYPDRTCICGEHIPQYTTAGSDCLHCSHCFCVLPKRKRAKR